LRGLAVTAPTWESRRLSVEAVSIPSQIAAAQRADRFIYLGMAALFVAVAAIGFGPRSIGILSGTLPNPPAIVHVHAALMASWLVLLLVQTSLMETGRRSVHQKLGVVSFVLAPLMFVAMLVLTFAPYYIFLSAGPQPATGTPPPLDLVARGTVFSLFVQGRAALLFAVFYVWAVVARRNAPETHKRMMIMATLVLIDAALGRMGWLTGFTSIVEGRSYTIVHIYQLLLLAPAIVYDLVRFGRVHRAYVVGVALFLPFAIATHALWNHAGWQRAVGALFGIG
jgi:hypothetical protein